MFRKYSDLSQSKQGTVVRLNLEIPDLSYPLLLTHILSKPRERQSRRDFANKDFRKSFDAEVALIKAGKKDAFDILGPSFQKHEAAMNEFTRYLSWWEKRRFGEKWD